MARPIVRYLDPVSGEYEFATVVDIGDLRNLNTTIKSDIVGAINSIISDGVHNPVNGEKIEDLERIINSLKDGSFKINDFGSIDEYLKQQFLDEIDKINAQNRVEIQSVLTELDTSVNDAVRDYQEKVAAQNTILESAENTLADARGALEAKAREVETAKIGLSKLETEFNELDSYISTNVRTIDFDNFNAMIEDYETVVTQASDKVGANMSGSTLSYLTGRVSDAEANISAQADEITSKMSYDEFQYMPVPKYSYGENLLFDTFDFGDAWSGKNGAQVISDTFLFGKVVAFNSPTGSYETRTDDLTIGESYVLSAYVNTQPSEKSPSQVKYEPISRGYDPTDFKVQIGDRTFNPGVYEDLSGINGWVRINQEFVANAVNPPISITPAGINSQSEVAYMAMPKLEKGLTVTPWQPHVKDNYATMSSTQSMIRQQANSITAFVTEVSELDDSYKQATSTFKMLADGFKASTEALEAYEDAVTRYGTEYSNINGKFEQKIWKDDFKAVIEDINIDNRNRVFNSDFIRNEISSSDRRLIVEDWSLSSDWTIKTIDNNEYLSRTRTGLAQNLITSASSRYFPVKNKERILFGFDLIHSGLDNDQVFAIELFDIGNKRLLKQEFSLSSLTKVGNRYHGTFNISTPGAEKGSVVLQLPRNGNVSFTKISFQSADIGSVDWSPAPEDSWIIQSKLATYISQVENEVTIGGVGQKIDTLAGLLTEDKGTFTLNPDKIATEVFSSQTYDDMGFVSKTNFEQTADGWMQEITSQGKLAGHINASPNKYRISFDKILLEGTTWADAIGSSEITVTEKFALMGQNGIPVLNVNNDGSIDMNVSSLRIGPHDALTSRDKESIKKDVADSVIETTKPYMHIAYADTEDGEGLSFSPSGKDYIGLSKSHLPTPPDTPSSYTWSRWRGRDGSSATARNLLLGSRPRSVIDTDEYNIARFYMVEKPIVGETYSITIKGELGSQKHHFGVYNSGGLVWLGNLTSAGDGLYTAAVKWKNDNGSGAVDDSFISIYAMPSSVEQVSKIEWATMVRGYVPLTEWAPAHEDTQAKIDEKASASDVTAALVDLQQELEAAATAGELEDFIERYNKDLAARESEKLESESRLSKAQDSIRLITNEMSDRSEVWNFLERSVSNTPEGMVVGNESTGSYLLIKEDKISFYSNDNEVAFISQNLMEISRGAFVEEIQISEYKLEGSTKGHLTFRYVGA